MVVVGATRTTSQLGGWEFGRWLDGGEGDGVRLGGSGRSWMTRGHGDCASEGWMADQGVTFSLKFDFSLKFPCPLAGAVD